MKKIITTYVSFKFHILQNYVLSGLISAEVLPEVISVKFDAFNE